MTLNVLLSMPVAIFSTHLSAELSNEFSYKNWITDGLQEETNIYLPPYINGDTTNENNCCSSDFGHVLSHLVPLKQIFASLS